MNIYLAAIGCRLNEAELETWSRQLQDAGHHVVEAPTRAHAMVFNSCAVTTEAARKSRHFVRRLHRQNPSAPVVVTGCYAALEREKVAALMGVDLVVSNEDKDDLVARVIERAEDWQMPQLAEEPDSQPLFVEGRTRAFIKVQDGCRNRCTFCIVTIARGKERSRSVDEVVEEINALHAQGFQEAVLAGVHLGGYGSDIGSSLSELVSAVLDRTTIPRVRLGSLEPWDLPDGFWSLWRRSDRLCAHLHLPLQSGSDSVLRRMARRCFTERYAELVSEARAVIPHLNITTDLIVGFPGETEEEWAQTLEYVERIGFGHIHIFAYSAREGTTAARMKGQLPKATKRARSRDAHGLAERMKNEHLTRFVGRFQDVLWEGGSEEMPDGQARVFGYTDNYLRVEATVAGGRDLTNRITPVLITEVVEGGRLSGQIVGAALADEHAGSRAASSEDE